MTEVIAAAPHDDADRGMRPAQVATAIADAARPWPPEIRRQALLLGEDPSRLAAIEANLVDAGFVVVVCRHGDELGACDCVARSNLVVVDIVPGQDGALVGLVWRALRSAGPDHPALLAIVDGEDEQGVHSAFRLGASDVLSRPVCPALFRVKATRLARVRPRNRRPRTIGSYEIVRVLGQGGMGVVYLARTLDGREIALKVLDPPPLQVEPETLVRFRRESEILRTVRAPGIPRLIEAGRTQDCFFFAMEYIAGESLDAVIKRRGAFPEKTAVRLLDEVGAALEALHAVSAVHRDPKPSNIIVDSTGEAKLIDFGLAKMLAGDAVTSDGLALGTPAYMAPELFLAAPAGRATDAFALGMVVLEALFGSRPIEGTPYQIAQLHAARAIPRAAALVPDASPALVAAIDGLTEFDPTRRLGIPAARSLVAGCRRGA